MKIVNFGKAVFIFYDFILWGGTCGDDWSVNIIEVIKKHSEVMKHISETTP